MKRNIYTISMILILLFSNMMTMTLKSEESEFTINILNGRGDANIAYTGGRPIDRFWIVDAPGITWLKLAHGSGGLGGIYETIGSVLYDGVPLVGTEVICPKRYPPCEGCGWDVVHNLKVMAWGNGTIKIRVRWLDGEPYNIEGNYILTDNSDGSYMWEPVITANPGSVQPGNAINLQITIPIRIRQHISGLTLHLPVPPDAPPNTVNLPFDIDGVYNYTWTVPLDPYYEKLNSQAYDEIWFTANSNKPNEAGQFYTVTSGRVMITLSSTLSVKMVFQGKFVADGSNNTWEPNREREVGAYINAGREPFNARWIINGLEVEVPWEYRIPESRNRNFKDQNALANAGTITFEVIDGNGNRASGTIYVGIKTGMDFVLSVQGKEVKPGETVNWREGSSKIVTTRQVATGQLPYRTRWLVNGTEYLSQTSRAAMYQYEDQEVLNKATSITFEVTDANNVQKSYTINIGNPGGDKDTEEEPAGPVGPAPSPPPLTGNPNREPDPTVPWNNRPWMDERVRQCARQYLQNIVLYVENEYIKWENTGLSKTKQRVPFSSIDDWGRLLNQYITTSGGVDGNWDNPTHYVWSVFNKPEAATRYGRTVDYYCKYECSLLEPSPDELKNAIDDVSDDEENNKWDPQKIKNAQNNLNDLLELARSLYNKFNVNYNKLVNEINDQKSNPVENEIIALCLASAENQFNDHSVNKDSLDVTGNALIAQSAINQDIDMFGIIRILSEVQIQNDDMTKKLAEMKNLLTARGGDIDEIITSGQRLIAQGNVDPEFAQDGGVNVEFFADGVDNFGDGLQDFLYGNVRRGNVLFVVWDAGNVADDIFELVISGRGSLGTTPPGGRRNFDLTLNPGTYTITIKGVYTDPNSTPCTFGIQVYDRDLLILQEANSMEEGLELTYSITVR